MRLPDRRFAVALLQRAIYLWIGGRLLLALAGGGMGANGGFQPLALPATGLLVLLVGFLGLLEASRRNEHLLLANFGVPRASLAALSALPAILSEAIIWLLVRP